MSELKPTWWWKDRAKTASYEWAASTASRLPLAFVWEDTPQGWAFWHNVQVSLNQYAQTGEIK